MGSHLEYYTRNLYCTACYSYTMNFFLFKIVQLRKQRCYTRTTWNQSCGSRKPHEVIYSLISETLSPTSSLSVWKLKRFLSFKALFHLKRKMAASLEIPRSTSQVRSISLPSRSDALRVSIEDQLVRLRASETSASCSVSPICQKLIGIKDLYEQLNDMIQLPLNQQVLTLDLHRNGVEDVLDGSLNLLDVCGTTIDVLSMMKNSVLELQSFLRRRSSIAAALAIDVSSYITSRKKIKKIVSKCLKNLQKAGNEKDGRLVPATRVLQDAEAACLSTLKSSLAYLLGEKAKSKVHGWSLVSKLMHSKPVAPAPMTDEDTNEVDMIDMTLCALERKKSSTDMKTVQQLLKQLETLHLAIQEFEDCLASISRCLVKTRVSLLNVLNY